MAERPAPARRPLVGLALAGILVVGSTLAACSSDPPSPAQQRRDHVERRLEATFSRTQARCILDQLDEPTIRALDRSATLDAGSDELTTYTNAVTACVLGFGG